MQLLCQELKRCGPKAAALAALLSFAFGSCCAPESAFAFQPASAVGDDLKPYAGTWRWIFQNKPFTTLNLVLVGDHFTGSMTNGSFTTDKDGNMTAAQPESGTSVVVRTYLTDKILHIVVEDGKDKSQSEFTMTLTAPHKAEFNVAGDSVPKNVKPWLAEFVSDDTPASADTSKPCTLAGMVTSPRITHSEPPAYPENGGIGGKCIVAFVVDKTGSPKHVTIAKTGGADFDQAAIAAVKKYKFTTAMCQGEPVAVRVSIEIRFQLR